MICDRDEDDLGVAKGAAFTMLMGSIMWVIAYVAGRAVYGYVVDLISTK